MVSLEGQTNGGAVAIPIDVLIDQAFPLLETLFSLESQYFILSREKPSLDHFVPQVEVQPLIQTDENGVAQTVT